MVVHSAACVDDKLFQSLAVTAHKWLRIEQVRRWELAEYLVRMRAEGYKLVGTEQTEQSRCMSRYQFAPKCCLLLGNEKEGIPPELLQLMDECVEIPQRGVVRSLNVHVSAAIAVWEYSKQQIVDADVGGGDTKR